MINVGQSKFATQKRVIELFEQQLGYSDLGYWHNRQHNRIRVRSLTFSLDGNLNDAGNTFLQDLQRRR